MVKQRVSVRAIVRDEEKVLLLRRSAGRQTILGKFELPGGKVAYGEQPEDALRRILHDKVGLHIQGMELYDAVTYIDHDDRSIQFGVLVYLVTLAPGHHGIRLNDHYNMYSWQLMKEAQQDEITDLTALLLGIFQQESVVGEQAKAPRHVDSKHISSGEYVIYSDGGSRGNPGPSAAGFVIIDSSQEVVEQGGEYIGITTSSQAEYHGVRLALERALEIGCRRVDFRVDSMLVMNQMNGVYKIKNRELWPIYERIKKLVAQFDAVRFSHVKREFNQLADGMVNKTLDAHAASKKL